VAIVAANLVPVAGVTLWGWQVRDVIFLYWFENVVVGVFFILRILCTSMETLARNAVNRAATAEQLWNSKVIFAGINLLFFGALCFGNAQFLVAFFHPANQPEAMIGTLAIGMLREPGAVKALLAIIASHALSFCLHDPFSRRVRTDEEKWALVTDPYKRLVPTSFIIFVGGFFLEAIDEPILPMVVIVAVKTAIDVVLHLRLYDSDPPGASN
jgi:phosphate/sulfate permease